MKSSTRKPHMYTCSSDNSHVRYLFSAGHGIAFYVNMYMCKVVVHVEVVCKERIKWIGVRA